MRLATVLAASLLVTLSLPSAPARAQSTDVVVGVPVQNGTAGKPQPGVIVDVDGRRQRQRERVPAPIVVQEGSPAGGTTTVRPNFGGGYTAESPGKTTTVRPRFGGGYAVEENGKTTTEVKPNFGGGYTVESSGKSPTLLLPPPEPRR
jgi:hypothetical protein